jgi:hypothetical protein
MSMIFTELTPDEKIEYQKLLTFVRARRQAFIEVLDALSVIHERKLYREQYSTFEGFCMQELGMSRMALNRLQRSQVNKERVKKHAPEVTSRLNSVAALNALEGIPNSKIRDVVRAADTGDRHFGPSATDIFDAASVLGVTNPIVVSTSPDPKPEMETQVLPGLELEPGSDVALPTFVGARKGFEKFVRYMPDLEDQAEFIIKRYPKLAEAIAEKIRE